MESHGKFFLTQVIGQVFNFFFTVELILRLAGLGDWAERENDGKRWETMGSIGSSRIIPKKIE